jgi:predicted nuclease with TOPRIM domain
MNATITDARKKELDKIELKLEGIDAEREELEKRSQMLQKKIRDTQTGPQSMFTSTKLKFHQFNLDNNKSDITKLHKKYDNFATGLNEEEIEYVKTLYKSKTAAKNNE